MLWIFGVIVVCLKLVNGDYVQPINSKQPHFDLSSLKFVSVIARHGSRATWVSFPSNTHHVTDRQFWPYGPAELTNVGRRQAFAVGLKLRSRYRGFVDDIYDKNQVVIQSNLFSRGMLSAELIAAGLYPPTGYQIWNESMSWQPIEVWPINFDVSSMQNECTQFEKWSKNKTEQVMNDIFKTEDIFIQNVLKWTGGSSERLFECIKYIYDPLFFQRDNGYKLPAWADDAFMDKLGNLTTRWWLAETVGSTAQIRLAGGPHISWLIDQLTRQSKDGQRLEFSVFVGHDSTIIAILYGLGIHEEMIPNPGSYLAVELHENGTDSFVQILFFNDSSATTPVLLEMPDCPHPCKIERFVEVGQRTVPLNWDLECFGTSSGSNVSSPSVLLVVIFSLWLIMCENLKMRVKA